ncbi:AsnC family transcriptional regulator [Mycobacterium sp. MS1601]|uniref:Lrp/AsnC family transcriptional regulator n=1 Tax=Mycobacterium sp. MS1601 TaxID=1936029 RepID=UPI000979697E|nr:Lrp/AsnC family transcriptional regulator [Mycobacterium sp. MS1601]AQA06609.1 AsnC family transcriptional regulator [Mycobacterium sp. MS1601]
MLTLDRLDVQLIRLLSRDARLGVMELSNELGVARNTVQTRLTRLRESGLVAGFRPEVDLAAAGVAVQAFITLELVQGELQSVVRSLTAIPEVMEIHATTGQADLLIRVATRTHSELQRLIERVVSISGVAHSNTSLSLTVPLAYRILPLLDHFTQDAGWGRSTPPPRVTE